MKGNTTRRFVYVSRLLGKIPSLVYALLYLALIPTFAAIYNYLPDQFYHSTIKYEQAISKDKEAILKEIKRVLTVSFIDAHHGNECAVEDRIIDIENMEVRSLEVESEQVKFSFTVPLETEETRKSDMPPWPQIFSAEISFSLLFVPTTESEDQAYYGTLHKIISVKELTELPELGKSKERRALLKALFPYKSDWVPSEKNLIMPISGSLQSELVKYSNGLYGFPSDLSGNFWRMFYLSAVTITTLGYGDIVPITNLSRGLISLESILGIILIGLFLNALAHERDK